MTKNRTPALVYLDPGMHPGLEVKGLKDRSAEQYASNNSYTILYFTCVNQCDWNVSCNETYKYLEYFSNSECR